MVLRWPNESPQAARLRAGSSPPQGLRVLAALQVLRLMQFLLVRFLLVQCCLAQCQ